MKIKSILLVLILSMVIFIGLSAFLQDRLSKGFVDQAAVTQSAFIKTGALVDDLRLLQIAFKWQVQAFKDVVLRGKDPDLLFRYKSEFDANDGRVKAAIENVTNQMQSAEYAPVAETLKQLFEEHKLVSSKYSDAIVLYTQIINGNAGGNGLAADVAVRGIDRQLTAEIDSIAGFVRKQNEINSVAASQAAAQMRKELSSKLYMVSVALIAFVLIAGLFVIQKVMSVLGAEPVVLRNVAEKISDGDLTTNIPSHDLDNESSLASHLLLMQMKVRSLVIGIHDEAKGALERARNGGSMEEMINDVRALSKSMRKFKTGAGEQTL